MGGEGLGEWEEGRGKRSESLFPGRPFHKGREGEEGRGGELPGGGGLFGWDGFPGAWTDPWVWLMFSESETVYSVQGLVECLKPRISDVVW